MRLRRGFRFVICCVHGGLIFYVCRRLNLNGLLEELLEVYGAVHIEWLYLGLEGASRGIVLMWDRRAVEKVEEAVVCFSVSCRFKNVGNQFEWAFTGLYGPNLNKRHRKMWEELTGLINWWDVPWCLAGDFNIIRFPSKRLGATTCTWAMYGFF